MCLSCGCGKPPEDYGDKRHITMEKLDQAAQAADITREQALQNIVNTVAQAQGQQSSSGQSTGMQSGTA
jgi:hypothetical protein